MGLQAWQISLPHGRLQNKDPFSGYSAAADVGSSHGTHAGTATGRTDADVNVPGSFQQFRHGEPRISLMEPLVSLQGKDKPQVFRLHPVVQEAVITDLLKTFREYVHQETADKFRVFQRDFPPGFPRLPAPCRESGVRFRDREDPAVGDGGLMGVTAEVFNGIPETVEGFL